MGKSSTLLLILTLILPSIVIATSMPVGCATTKPSVPQFTVKFENGTSYHAAVYSFDPYTGKNETVSQAYYQEWEDILLTIQNQPFNPYKDSNGTWIQLYYNIQAKAHFSDSNSWTTVMPCGSDPDDMGYMPQQSNSNFSGAKFNAENYSPNSTVDFRVQAMIGYLKDSHYSPVIGMQKVFVGETSDWSSIKTITIGTNSTTIDSSSSPTPSTPELPPVIVFGAVFLVTAVLFAVVKSKRGTARFFRA